MDRQWIKSRLKELGLTQNALAKALGVERPRITEIIAGRREIKLVELKPLANALGMAVEDVLAKLGIVSEVSFEHLVPLVGNVGAGGDVQRGDADMDYVKAPIAVFGKLEALRVEGVSMYPELQPGDLIFYDTADDRGPDTHIGHVVAVETANGDLLVKMLRRGSAPDVYDLHSHNPAEPPRENVRLKSVSRVIFMDRRGRP